MRSGVLLSYSGLLTRLSLEHTLLSLLSLSSMLSLKNPLMVLGPLQLLQALLLVLSLKLQLGVGIQWARRSGGRCFLRRGKPLLMLQK